MWCVETIGLIVKVSVCLCVRMIDVSVAHTYVCFLSFFFYNGGCKTHTQKAGRICCTTHTEERGWDNSVKASCFVAILLEFASSCWQLASTHVFGITILIVIQHICKCTFGSFPWHFEMWWYNCLESAACWLCLSCVLHSLLLVLLLFVLFLVLLTLLVLVFVLVFLAVLILVLLLVFILLVLVLVLVLLRLGILKKQCYSFIFQRDSPP